MSYPFAAPNYRGSDGGVGCLERCLGHEVLRSIRPATSFPSRNVAENIDRNVDHLLCRKQVRVHLHKRMLNGLIAPDQAVEHFALVGVLKAALERRYTEADALRSDDEVFLVQLVET